MAQGLREIAALDDPVGEVLEMEETKWSSNWKTKSTNGSYRHNI